MRRTPPQGGRRRLGWALALLVAVPPALLLHTAYFRPLRLEWLFARVHWQALRDDPERMSLASRLPRWLDDSARRLGDLSPRSLERRYARARRDYAHWQGFDCADYADVLRDSCETLGYSLRLVLDGEPFRFHAFPLDPVFGVQNSLPAYLASQHRIDDWDDADDYIARLEALPAKLASLQETLVERERRGLHPTRRQLDEVLAQLYRFIATSPDNNLLSTSFQRRLAALAPGARNVRRLALEAQVREAVALRVYPAYRALIGVLERQRRQAHDDEGAWALPDGTQWYAHLVRLYTDSEATPAELHALGIGEVVRLSALLDAALRAEGLGEGAIGTRVRQLAARADQRFADSASGRAALLSTLQARLDAARAPVAERLPRPVPPPVEVLRMPPALQASAPGALYAPTSDGGRLYVNLRNIDEWPRFALPALAHHEGLPGHHAQDWLQRQQPHLPAFRHALAFPAYAEGWAMYAEQFAGELGLNDSLAEIGRLQSELFRAARLVVDTGLHWQRWERERAIRYLEDRVGLAGTDATAEVDRYLAAPGRALSFTVGLHAFRALRAAAHERAGDGFDLTAFHAVVLEGGRMPLPVLERRVMEWAAATAHR